MHSHVVKLCALLLVSLLSAASSGEARAAVAGSRSADDAVTVHARLQLPHASEAGDVHAFVLAGLAEESGAAPGPLFLAWVKESHVWLPPTWRLQLHSDSGLLSAGPGQVGVDASMGSTFLMVANIPPRWGETYDTMLSFDPSTGHISLWVENAVSGERVYGGAFVTRTARGPFYPASGFIVEESGSVAERFRTDGERLALPSFVPRAVDWGLVEMVDGRAGPAPRWPLDRRRAVGLLLQTPGRGDGVFRVYAEQAGARDELLAVEASAGERLISIPTDALPFGLSTLVLEYRDDGGRLWLSERREIVVGRMELALGHVDFDMGDRSALSGVVWVDVDGPFPPFDLEIEYELRVPERIAPLHEGWQVLTGQAVVPVPGLKGGGEKVSFRLPLDTLPVWAVDRESFLEVGISADNGVEAIRGERKRFALGERAPPFPSVGELHVLRGDFHMHTSESHDSRVSPGERVWDSYKYGYDVIAFTDHGSVRAYDYGIDFADELGLVLLRGMETGLEGGSVGEHLAVIGIDGDYQTRHEHAWARGPNQARVFYQEQIRTVVAHGGFVVYAHPGWPNPVLETDAVRWMVENGYLHGVEALGQHSGRRQDWAFQFALDHGLTLFEVSDVHDARDYDAAGRAPVTLVFAKDRTADGVMDALRNQRTLIWRAGELRGRQEWLMPFLHSMVDVVILQGENGACLAVENRGPLMLSGFARVHGDIENPRHVVLAPGARVCLDASHDASGVHIRWENIFTAPGRRLESEHVVE